MAVGNNPPNIADVGLHEGMEGIAKMALARKARDLADRIEMEALDCFRRCNANTELASKQIDAIEHELSGVA